MSHPTPSTAPKPGSVSVAQSIGAPTFPVDHKQDLVYYDGPLIFTAQDERGGLYVCMWLSLTVDDHSDSYLCAAATPVEVNALIRGVVDLRALLTAPRARLFHGRVLSGADYDGRVHLTHVTSVPGDWFPGAGLDLSHFVGPETIAQADGDPAPIR